MSITLSEKIQVVHDSVFRKLDRAIIMIVCGTKQEFDCRKHLAQINIANIFSKVNKIAVPDTGRLFAPRLIIERNAT